MVKLRHSGARPTVAVALGAGRTPSHPLSKASACTPATAKAGCTASDVSLPARAMLANVEISYSGESAGYQGQWGKHVEQLVQPSVR